MLKIELRDGQLINEIEFAGTIPELVADISLIFHIMHEHINKDQGKIAAMFFEKAVQNGIKTAAEMTEKSKPNIEDLIQLLQKIKEFNSKKKSESDKATKDSDLNISEFMKNLYAEAEGLDEEEEK